MRYDEHARMGEAAESAQIRLESDTNALKLITIHKSKGLEYPVVVAPFLWDGPSNRPNDREYVRCHTGDDDRLTIDLGSDQLARHTALCKRETLAENLRLLYVALTRAQHLCIVPWGAFNQVEGSALGYLLHQPSGTSEDLAEATCKRIKKLSDGLMRADLEHIAAASEGAIEVVELSTAAAERFASSPGIDQPLQLREMTRAILQPWRIASFSALAAGAPDPVLPEPLEGWTATRWPIRRSLPMRRRPRWYAGSRAASVSATWCTSSSRRSISPLARPRRCASMRFG
jgi:exodeoxyribonuclease V beta subunit